MFTVKTMTPSKASKQASAAASKIKNKILNTSSFFKISLKTNNKALALALEAQKERSRQLEREIVCLQKQLEALCFELATRKYKDRKLLLILKNLHRNTLQHFDVVADLFSDSDLPKLSQDNKTLFGNINDENLAVESPTDQLPPRPEMSRDLLCPRKNVTADLPEKNMDENVFLIQSRPIKSTDAYNDNTDVEKRLSSQRIQAPQTGTSRPSSSLRDEVERLSMIFSQSGSDMKAVLCPQNSQTSSLLGTCEKSQPFPTDNVNPPCGSVMETEPDHSNKQEKTLLLNTTMEMTQSNAPEIVTVETKAKKPRPKGQKKKEEARGSSVAENPQVKNSADSRMSEAQTAPADTVLQTDDQALEDIRDLENKCQSPKKQSRSILTSRLPKLSKSEAGGCQRMAKGKFKSHHHTKSKTESCDIVLPDLDDYFMDPENKVSKAGGSAKLPPEKDTAEEEVSRITYRRSRVKGRRVSSVTSKTVFTLPSRESESSGSKLEQPRNEEEEVRGKYEACKDQEQPDEFLFTRPESVYVRSLSPSGNHSQSKMKTTTNSGGSHKSKCRGTFVIAVARDSTSSNSASPHVGDVEQDLMPSTGSFHCEAEEPPTVLQCSESDPHRNSDRDFVKETQSSCKRPWVATQDSGIFRGDLGSNDNREVLLLDQDSTTSTEFQKPKKARREETGRSGKKKAAQRKECDDLLHDKKKRNKSSHSNKGLRSEKKARRLQEASDASPLCGTDDPERSEEQLDHLQAADISETDDIFEHLYDSKPTKSKSRMDSKPKECRKKSKLHTPKETTNPRETFVVYRRKTQDGISLNNARTCNVSGAYSHAVDAGDEAVHPNLGDLLADETPPWLAMDVSTANTEVDSLLASPNREASGGAAVIEESTAGADQTSPGRVLTSLTNTISTPDSANRGRTRRRNGVVSYKEPPLNSKIRRGDKFTDSMFLSSPVFKDGKKKRQKKTVAKPKLERSLFVD
ncbi:uncharacterized protein si:dkey-57a22.11 isoform X2 [Xiphias gladius]|uniref:uncharacterized protein si:dkey-57a22.11 isoform X2 n=1 Tax=Xiphias gladius TaxID=8245 RepID=UPI001A98334C|nr:uncharacterized protein si:dkey-57a22.11 isoform X2 [Xiphias gladius]